MIFTDYYQLLDISPTASDDEIRLAYRLLALKYHPDSHSDERSKELFYQIKEAYEVLSDRSKRRAYDEIYKTEMGVDVDEQAREARGGASAAGTYRTDAPLGNLSQPSAEAGGFWGRLGDGFREAMGLPPAGSTVATGMAGTWGRRRRKSTMDQLRGERLYSFRISALESITGTARQVVLGGQPHTRRAVISIESSVVPGTVFAVEARDELGNFSVVKAKVDVEPHPLVERRGNDIIFKVSLTIEEAVTGVELAVPTLTGLIKVKVPAGCQGGRLLRVKGKGIAAGENGPAGDYYVQTNLVLPDQIDDNVKRAAAAMNDFYSKPVRPEYPKSLKEL